MRGWLALLAVVLASAAMAQTRVDLPDGRWYLADLPSGPGRAPVIVALHGGAGNPVQFRRDSGLAAAALGRGYAVIWPAGTGRSRNRLLTWNAGYCCGLAARNGVDDLAFLRRVVADATERFHLDRSRVFATGMSNGAMMAELWAARHPGQLRAISAVSGSFDARNERVRGPVPLLILHGTDDKHVPFGGGRGEKALTRTNYAPVSLVIERFLAAWPGRPKVRERMIDARNDGTRLVLRDWVGADGVLRLRLVRIEGGAHEWPGPVGRGLRWRGSREISANEASLDFFDRFK